MISSFNGAYEQAILGAYGVNQGLVSPDFSPDTFIP
jgi:hypothetical protein